MREARCDIDRIHPIDRPRAGAIFNCMSRDAARIVDKRRRKGWRSVRVTFVFQCRFFSFFLSFFLSFLTIATASSLGRIEYRAVCYRSHMERVFGRIAVAPFVAFHLPLPRARLRKVLSNGRHFG
jgi:hypothetical protein